MAQKNPTLVKPTSSQPGPTIDPVTPAILPIRPEQGAETRRMIYIVANSIFHDAPTGEDAIAYYGQVWPLVDLDDIQANYIDENGAFLVTVVNGQVVGSGALKQLEEGICEIKRLWFLPEYQGKGLGYRLMQELLAIARQKGYRMARLETAPAYQKRAYEFYRHLGFYDIPRYGDEDDDIGMELVL